METASPSSVQPSPRARAHHLWLIALMGVLAACASGGQQSLRAGTLRAGIGQQAVIREWGFPARTASLVSEEQLGTRWGSAPVGPLFRERRPLDVWIFEKQGVELVFDDGDLVAWKTDRSADQLRAIARERPSSPLEIVGDGRTSLGHGLLRVDIGQKAFRSLWGPPERVSAVGTTEELAARWGPGMKGSVLDGKHPLEIWVYEKYGVELLFEHGDLAAWKTGKTVDELRAIPLQR